ncbi:MAG TPA: hypothetical protein VJ111_05955 [Chitinophagaceae bacterium]|nr:hypothetical protein [Chitinophagaceae bacterium]
MKTIFDKTTRDELIARINALNENNTAQWGKMNIYQMLKHCILSDEMFLGKKKYKRAFIGRLFGKMALKTILKDEKPLMRNTPTIPEFRIREICSFFKPRLCTFFFRQHDKRTNWVRGL